MSYLQRSVNGRPAVTDPVQDFCQCLCPECGNYIDECCCELEIEHECDCGFDPDGMGGQS